MSLRISCAGVTTVDVDGWRTGDGLPDITVFGTSEDTGSDEDRWPSAFVGGSFRVYQCIPWMTTGRRWCVELNHERHESHEKMRCDDLVVGWLFLVVLRFISWISCVSWMKTARLWCAELNHERHESHEKMRGDGLVVGWLFLVELRFISWISCVSWMKGAEAMCV